MKRLAYLTVLFALALSSACGKSDSATTPTPTPTPTPTQTRVISLSGNLNFGNVVVGDAGGATLTVTNSGNSTLTITSFTGPCPALALSWVGGTIAAGASQSVTVLFSPGSAGTCTGTLTALGDQTSGTNTIAVTATALAAYSKNLTGTWRGTLTVDSVVILNQSGKNLSGEFDAVGMKGSVTGTVGNSGQVTFTVTISGLQPFTFTGQADDAGNTISGQVNGSGFNNQAWTLKRQ